MGKCKLMKNVPNILSGFRICLVPVFIATYFCEKDNMHLAAVIIYAIASLTDVLDGYIARKYNLITNLGRILDPIGDKLMTLSVMTCITIDKLIPLWALILFAIKEILMLTGGFIIHKKWKMNMPSSNKLGKASTTIFFLVCGALILFPQIPRALADGMIAVAIVITFVAFGSYLFTFKNISSSPKKGNAGEER